MDLFIRRLSPVKQLVQSRHQFFRCLRVKELNRHQGLLQVGQHRMNRLRIRHTLTLGCRSIKLPCLRTIDGLTPVIREQLHRCRQIE